MHFPTHATLIEVGPRDGLQNEACFVPTATKIELIERLGQCGFSTIEVTSFVSPAAIPQMADHADVMKGVKRRASVTYPVLVPNLKGLEAALATGVRAIAVFTAASDTFTQKNIHCTVSESLKRFEPVLKRAQQEGLKVRGYVSCALGCPYEGEVAASEVARVARALFEMGCQEISLGDTIGYGTPPSVQHLIEAVAAVVPCAALAGHFHDTYGVALLNIYTALQCGVTRFDSAVGGLGGCPYAPGASGNVASEDVVYLLHRLGIQTGIDLDRLIEASWFICKALGKTPQSRVAWVKQNGSKFNPKKRS